MVRPAERGEENALSASTVAMHERHVRLYLVPCFGKRDLRSLTPGWAGHLRLASPVQRRLRKRRCLQLTPHKQHSNLNSPYDRPRLDTHGLMRAFTLKGFVAKGVTVVVPPAMSQPGPA